MMNKILKKFYDEVIDNGGSRKPAFEELTEQQKRNISKSLAFAGYRASEAAKRLKKILFQTLIPDDGSIREPSLIEEALAVHYLDWDHITPIIKRASCPNTIKALQKIQSQKAHEEEYKADCL